MASTSGFVVAGELLNGPAQSRFFQDDSVALGAWVSGVGRRTTS